MTMFNMCKWSVIISTGPWRPWPRVNLVPICFSLTRLNTPTYCTSLRLWVDGLCGWHRLLLLQLAHQPGTYNLSFHTPFVHIYSHCDSSVFFRTFTSYPYTQKCAHIRPRPALYALNRAACVDVTCAFTTCNRLLPTPA